MYPVWAKVVDRPNDFATASMILVYTVIVGNVLQLTSVS